MTRKTCDGCKNGLGFETPFSMAYQPIVDTTTGAVFAYEALVRGAEGQSAYSVLSQVTEAKAPTHDPKAAKATYTLFSV